MNNVYDVILLNLMLIENEENPLIRMIAYAKIGGIVEYSLVKEDIKEEKAEQLMYLLTQNIYSCIDQLDS